MARGSPWANAPLPTSPTPRTARGRRPDHSLSYLEMVMAGPVLGDEETLIWNSW